MATRTTASALDSLRADNLAAFADFRNDMRAHHAQLRADVRQMTATLTEQTASLGQSIQDTRRSVDGLRSSVNKMAAMFVLLVAVVALGVMVKRARTQPRATAVPQVVIVQTPYKFRKKTPHGASSPVIINPT